MSLVEILICIVQCIILLFTGHDRLGQTDFRHAVLPEINTMHRCYALKNFI